MLEQKGEFRQTQAGLKRLEEEHALIHRHYAELDDAIFQAEGSPRILQAAIVLAESMFLHIEHESRFLSQLPVKAPSTRAETRPELLHLLEQLRNGDIYFALHLRSLSRRWLQQHMKVEQVEGESPVWQSAPSSESEPRLPA